MQIDICMEFTKNYHIELSLFGKENFKCAKILPFEKISYEHLKKVIS